MSKNELPKLDVEATKPVKPVYGVDDFNVEITDGNAVATLKDDKAYLNGGGFVTSDEITRVSKWNNMFITAVTEAAKDVTLKVMGENKDVNKMTTSANYGISTKGGVDVLSERSRTYPGMNGGPDVTKSTMKVVVTDPLLKMGKTAIKRLEKELTENLID